MHSEIYKIGSSDIDKFYEQKVSSIFMMLQEAAMHAVETIGADSNELKKIDIDWIITRMEVEIFRLPVFHEEVKVVTYPGDDLMMLYPRYYMVYDKDDNLLIRGASLWALLNNKTRKVEMRRDIIKKQTPEHMDNELPLPGRVNKVDDEYLETRKIYYSEIDLNGHLNNCSYIRIVQDIHDSNFYEKYRVKKICLNYLKELREGYKIDIYSKCDSNNEFVRVVNNDEDCFYANIEYLEK